MEVSKLIQEKHLGIELGSTRIKLVLINQDYKPLASGEYSWKNKLEKNYWTYDLNDVWTGIQAAYLQLKNEFNEKYKLDMRTLDSIGVSAMMHGYLPFDEAGNLLTPFRTWRNTNTDQATEILSREFSFNIPHRWSIAHLYQAILDKETHVAKLDFMTTLAGYVHWQLTGEKVLGVGDASGMFPIDSETGNYNSTMIEKFQAIKGNENLDLEAILPQVMYAGREAGNLTDEGAKLLDPDGLLSAGVPFCPPEGDAGTGMIATNSILPKTGNISAGTSIFSMFVLEKQLENYYSEVDIVTTPSGSPVAMIHCNNFTSDINEWVDFLYDVTMLTDSTVDKADLFSKLFTAALSSDEDLGKMIHYSYFSGEPIINIDAGRPLLLRHPNSKVTVSNFMNSLIYSALITLKVGSDLLLKNEQVDIKRLIGHGGFFKTKYVSQQIMSDVLGVPITVMDHSSEGGAWGIAVLAAYSQSQQTNNLAEFLEREVFSSNQMKTVSPTEAGKEKFNRYFKSFQDNLEIERLAIKSYK